VDQGVYVIFAADGCIMQCHMVQKINHRQKWKVQGLCLQGLHTWLYSESDRYSTVRRRGDDASLASTATALTPSPREWRPVTDPAVYWMGSKFTKWFMFYQIKQGRLRPWENVEKDKRRKETIVACTSCGVTLCKTQCFGK
jgi:hypothetical protein